VSRRIVKYTNRRLYDPTDGRQITLVELSDLVLSGEDVVVEEKRTGADITAVTVLQSVIERLRRGGDGPSGGRLAERLLGAVRDELAGADLDTVDTVSVGSKTGEGV
jgi:polyhydroxyalkanoate synthesis regulator protein